MEDEEKNKTAIDRTIYKSEDDFENKLTYITAGALGLSFGFIEKIVNIESSTYKWLLVCGWIFLCGTLLINLISHFVSKKISYKIQDDLDELDKDDKEKVIEFNKNVTRLNSRIDLINYFSAGFLVIGITLIITYASINISKVHILNKKQSIDNTKLQIDSATIDIKYQDFSLQINDTIFKLEKHGKKN